MQCSCAYVVQRGSSTFRSCYERHLQEVTGVRHLELVYELVGGGWGFPDNSSRWLAECFAFLLRWTFLSVYIVKTSTSRHLTLWMCVSLGEHVVTPPPDDACGGMGETWRNPTARHLHDSSTRDFLRIQVTVSDQRCLENLCIFIFLGTKPIPHSLPLRFHNLTRNLSDYKLSLL